MWSVPDLDPTNMKDISLGVTKFDETQRNNKAHMSNVPVKKI